MKIGKKENLGIRVSLNFDKDNYKKIVSEFKELGKKYESKSNVDKLSYSIVINGQKNPYMNVKGWCSRVIDKSGKVSEIIFLDYDNILYRIMEEELNYVCKEHNLPPFYVFTTAEDTDINGEKYGNYTAVCLAKKTFGEVVHIQDLLHCDQAFKKVALVYRFKTWVLRTGKKGKKSCPKFRNIIGDLNKSYPQEVSSAHLNILKGLYPIPKINYLNLDKDGRIFLTEYKTASK